MISGILWACDSPYEVSSNTGLCSRAGATGAVPATQRTSSDPAFFQLQTAPTVVNIFIITQSLLTSQVKKLQRNFKDKSIKFHNLKRQEITRVTREHLHRLT